MKIKAFANRYNMTLGEGPAMLIAADAAEAWYGRDPFEEVRVEGLSGNLMMAPEGTTDGHNLIRDSMFNDSISQDKLVPLSPLFVKDLAGRAIYIGFGPDRKGNVEWAQYVPPAQADGTIAEEDVNPFVPLCVFPRFCRDAAAMAGHEWLERVFLTKFRCLEMSRGFNGQVSGADEDEPLVNATYTGANLYPYKLRLDTFYVDGWKLPQTQLLFARGEAEGINPTAAARLAEQLMAGWQQKAAGVDYVAWVEGLGEDGIERLYQNGCTLIPTFEACNGYQVVGRDFGLEDYWPGRVVLGLHDVVEVRGDKSPDGTILEVVEPGFVTATRVRPAKVVISDGSGYVSPNASDPLPLVPNLHLPHPRTIDDWRATWLPTHPEHFEVPAMWGWDIHNGRFMQLNGPLWDPLHYYYESVDHVLAAFERSPLKDRKGLVMVPEEMEHRFFPVVPMRGFETFSVAEYTRREEKSVLPQSCLKRVATEGYTAGIGYHPLPAEYEFELDPFWFPELHPLNRDQGMTPADMDARLAPVVDPKVTVTAFVATVDAPENVTWWADETLMFTPEADPIANYPQLTRYLVADLAIEEVIRLCPVPYLGDPGPKLKLPAPGWWLSEDGTQLDGPLALQEVASNIQDALWDMRQAGVEIVQFRHMVYQGNLPLYLLAWWFGWEFDMFKEAVEDWIKDAPVEEL